MHLQLLLKKCHVISLDELVERVKNNDKFAPKTVAITFDGAWVNSYTNAFPVLMKHRIPATVFIATGFVGTLDMYWDEKLSVALVYLHDNNLNVKDIPFIQEFFPEITNEDVPDVIAMSSLAGELILKLKKEPQKRAAVFESLRILIDKIGGIHIERSFMNWEELKSLPKDLFSNRYSRRISQIY